MPVVNATVAQLVLPESARCLAMGAWVTSRCGYVCGYVRGYVRGYVCGYVRGYVRGYVWAPGCGERTRYGCAGHWGARRGSENVHSFNSSGTHGSCRAPGSMCRARLWIYDHAVLGGHAVAEGYDDEAVRDHAGHASISVWQHQRGPRPCHGGAAIGPNTDGARALNAVHIRGKYNLLRFLIAF